MATSKDSKTAAQKREEEQERDQGRKPDSAAMDQAERDDGAKNRIQGAQEGEPHQELQPGQPSGPEQEGSFPSMGGMKAPTDKDAAPKTPPEGPTTYPAKQEKQDSKQESQDK